MKMVAKLGKMKQMHTKYLILTTKMALLTFLKSTTPTQATVQAWLTRQTTVSFQIVNLENFFIPAGAWYRAYKLCMTLQKGRRFLFGTDMT